MSDGPKSTIVFDGDSTGAVAALHAVDVEAKRAAASLQGAGSAIKGVGEGENIEKTTARVKSLREAIIRNGDAVVAQAKAYGEVEKALQKIDQKGQKVELFTNQLDYLRSAENMLSAVQQKQKAIAEAERSAVAENAHWNALKLQKLSEVKAAELAAAKASADAENQALAAARATAAFKVQALNDQLKGIKALAAESEKVAAAERSATIAFKLQSLNDQIKARKAAELAAINEVSAAKERAARKEDAALSSYLTRIRNSAVELQAAGKLPSERAAIYGKEFGLPSAEVAKQVTYLQSLENQLAKTGGRYNEMGLTAKGTAAALRQVPAQFTDIIVSLQGGQAPMTVLLQQGGQLKDVFGGVGNAAKAMGGYVLDLINPFTVAAAAVGTVGYAAYSASEDVKALNKALILDNGLTGSSTGSLSAIVTALSATGVSANTATEALIEFTGAGVKAGDSLLEFTKTAIDLERVGGASIKETAKAFAEIGKDPLSNLKVLTLATYQQIEALLEQGNRADAVRVAMAAFNDENKRVEQGLRAQEGTLDTSLRYWKDFGASVWNAVRGLSQAALLTPKTGNEQRAELQKRRDTYAAQGYDTSKEDEQLAYFKRLDDAQKGGIANQEKEIRLKTLLANLDAKDEGARKLRERNQLIADNTELLNAGLITQKRYNDILAAFDAKGAKSAAKGPTGNPFAAEQESAKLYAKYIEESSKALLDAQTKTDGLTKSQSDLLAMITDPAFQAMPEAWKQTALQSKYAAIAQEQHNAAMTEAEAANNKYIAGLNESAASIEKKLTALGDETRAYALSIENNISLAEAIDLVAVARLEEQKAIELSYGDEKAVAAIEREIKARKELAKELRKKADHTAEVEAGKAAAAATLAEWKRGWEETDRLARDVFTTWATDGSNAAQKIGDTLKKALLSAIYEATIKPIAFQLYTSIAGGGGAAGAVQGASNALSGGSSLAGAFGNAAGLFGQGFKAGFGSILGESGILGGVSAGTTAIGAGNIAGGLGTLAGAIGPVVVGLAALKSAMDYKVEATGSAIVANLGGGVTNVANRNDYRQTGGLFGGGTTNNSDWTAASADLTAYIDGQVKLVTESARAYGTALGLPVDNLDDFKKQIEVSLTGLNADQAKEALNKAIAGFGDDLVSANFGAAIDGLKQGSESASQTLVRVATEITTVNNTLGMLGGKLLSVDAAGIKAADGLVQAMGGLEAFQQQTASYYSQYYSQEEQRMQTALSIQARLAQGGIDVSIEQVLNGTREQFRALVDSFKDGGGLMDEAGQKAVAALMAVAGAFAGITTASANVSASSAEAAATESSFGSGVGTSGPSQSGWSGPGGPDGASEAANAILQERKTLQDELDNLTMTSTELLEKQRNALDESNRALFDQIQIAKESARVAEQNKSLQDEYNQLTMTSAQLRALEREEIAEANLELFDRITALKAEQEAIATANNAVDAALAGVQRAIDAEKKSIEAARQAAQERVGILKSIVDSIGSAVDNLRGNVDSTKSQAARQANAFIDNALATAQASGYMPDADDLKDAISKATAGINRDGLSQFEYEKQQLILAGKLEALGAIAEPQLSAAEEAVKVAETQLQVLDDIMEEARKQVDELRGIDTSVKSVEAAIAALTAAILASITAQGTSYRPKPNEPLPNVGGIKQQGLTYAEMQAHAINLSNWNANPVDAGTALYNAAVRYGYTSDDLDRAMGWTAGHSLEWALANGLPAFDVGTNMVPRDMVAQIHEGEAIIPKAYNPAAGGTSGNARLESLVEGLTKEVQRLQAIVNDGNKSNERIAVAVHGNPDRPVPIDVLENSAGLATA